MSYGSTLGGGYRLSRNFTFGEFSGWQYATREQVERLQQLVETVLQPIRDRFGTVRPTSWIMWSSGAMRTGAHATGGAVDFVVTAAPTAVVFWWALGEALPVGEFIDERDHIHATVPGVGGWGQWLIEPVEGEYVAPGLDPGDPSRPDFEIPGIHVEVSRFPAWMGWAALAALLLAMGSRERMTA